MDKKVKFSPEQLISATQFVRNFSQILKQAKNEPLFIRRGQEVQFVIMSLKEYEQLLKKSI